MTGALPQHLSASEPAIRHRSRDSEQRPVPGRDIRAGAGGLLDLCERTRSFQIATRATRSWLLRAVEYVVAREDVAQIVEVGAGYPRSPSVHEVAAEKNEAVRTLSVDNDSLVVSHRRAMLDGASSFAARADHGDGAAIAAAMGAVLDLEAPVAVCLSFVAELVDDPAALLDPVTSVLAPGSFVVLSHITDEVSPAVAAQAVQVYASYGIGLRPRSRAEITALLAGCELIEPGLVAPHHWSPPGELGPRRARRHGWSPPADVPVCCYVALGRVR